MLAVTGQDPVSVPKRCGAETELPKRWEGQLALGQDLFSLSRLEGLTHSGRWGNSLKKVRKAASQKQVPQAQPVIHPEAGSRAQSNLARLPGCRGRWTDASPTTSGACLHMGTVLLPDEAGDYVKPKVTVLCGYQFLSFVLFSS